MTKELSLPYWLRTIGSQEHGRHRRAVVDDWGEASYAELSAAMDSVAAGLRERGFARGDRIVTAMEPSLAHLTVILGAMAAGMVPAPLNVRLTPAESTAYLETLSPAAVVADSTYAELAHAVSENVIETTQSQQQVSLEARLAPLVGERRDELPELLERELAIIFPTGGTTGIPKGAVHTHRTLWLWLNACAHVNPRTSDDVELFFSPFFHITLGTNLLTPLLVGGEVWIQRKFDPRDALEAIDRGASRLMGAPTMFAALREQPAFATTRRENVSAIRFGSAPSDPAFVQGLLHDFPRARIRAGFGATEFGSVMGFDHEDLLAGRFTGVGRPLPGVVIRVLTDEGEEVADGTVGNLVVDCPWATSGYFGMESETTSVFQPDGVHIGDLASRSGDGWVTIAGRKKDMIISGGENVFPREVEEVVLLHPDVTDVIAYGMPDDYWGERIEVAVVLKPERAIGLEELRSFCRERLAGYKLPKSMRVIDGIPLTANNKPNRNEVRREAISAQSAVGGGD